MDAIKLLGSLMGNNATGGGLLGSLLGGGSRGGGGLGALAGLLGGGGGGAGGGGLGALAGMLGGGGGGGLGGMLSGLAGGGQPTPAPQKETDDAMLLIRAMCNAAKADGQIDENEIKNIVGRLGDVDEEEARFLKAELQAPIDLPGFLASVPADMAEQVYAFSLMGMKLDSQQEAQYLGAVAQGLGLGADVANQIHAKLGAPQIFS